MPPPEPQRGRDVGVPVLREAAFWSVLDKKGRKACSRRGLALLGFRPWTTFPLLDGRPLVGLLTGWRLRRDARPTLEKTARWYIAKGAFVLHLQTKAYDGPGRSGRNRPKNIRCGFTIGPPNRPYVRAGSADLVDTSGGEDC